MGYYIDDISVGFSVESGIVGSVGGSNMGISVAQPLIPTPASIYKETPHMLMEPSTPP